jgi:Carboxypeptidase regulatory-like domain/TonB dependent receptor
MGRRLIRTTVVSALTWICVLTLRLAAAQQLNGVVVDQTGLPLPGATVQLRNGDVVIATVATGPDGTFVFTGPEVGPTLAVSLDGFETSVVPASEAARIVLALARTTETTTVIGTAEPAAAAPTTSMLGSTIEATTVSRLPSAHMQARESLPLLPSIVRGPDGLLALGGARASDTPLFIDGFNVTNPATGISSINLPFEAVKAVDVLRDPMAVTYGELVGGLVQIRSTVGADRFKFGVQGLVPRPRFSSPGFGRLEGIFPRVYGGGSRLDGRVRYFAAAELDYERIPVPEVTDKNGPDVVEKSSTVFWRVDLQATPRSNVSLESLLFPTATRSKGLSPRREQGATTDFNAHDRFVGITDRVVLNDTSVLTIQASALTHDTSSMPNGEGISYLSPYGWRGNWFAAVERHSVRYGAKVAWQQTRVIGSKSHDFTLAGEVATRRLTRTVDEIPIEVYDIDGRLVRRVEFGPPSTIRSEDRPLSFAARDVWQASGRLTIDGGVRVDGGSGHASMTPSARFGVRYALDESARTVLKGGYGSFIASLPLAVEAYATYPMRLERDVDPETGATLNEFTYDPSVQPLLLPRALTATAAIERQITPRFDVQVSVTDRRTSRIATLRVPAAGGSLQVRSDGSSAYREFEISGRRRWDADQQVFVSYVRSSGRGEFNDFATLFQTLAVPLIQRAGVTRLPTDARDRIIAWGTANLPYRVVVSPVVEWRSGFPYTVVDQRYVAVETNLRSFPAFMATDLVIYKTFTVRKRSADLGIQLFNATNHFNPRDVHAVLGAPHMGQFANSVPTILRGFLMLKW